MALEAYEDDGENTFEVHVRAHMGRQKLSENQTGWLLLDLEWGVFPGNWIIKQINQGLRASSSR